MWKLLILIIFASSVLSQKCLDGSNNPVDWWIAYKLPRLSGNQYLQSGTGYAYMDERSSSFNIASSFINASTSFLARTLNQMYKNQSQVGYVIWNDESPDGGQNTNRAHAKGVLVYGSSEGFFLRHSIPNFPPMRKDSFSYPATGTIYGQTLLCLNVDIATIDMIAAQFLVNYPQVYDYSIMSSLSKFKNIVSLAQGNHDASKHSSVINIKTKKGLSVTDFAKSKEWDNDLWDSLVATTIKSTLYVESWGRPLMPSNCKTSFETINVKDVKFNSNVDFSETQDHSKWGITATGSTTCIGDINRMTSQRKRGGGTSCFNIGQVYKQFSTIISTKDKC